MINVKKAKLIELPKDSLKHLEALAKEQQRSVKNLLETIIITTLKNKTNYGKKIK